MANTKAEVEKSKLDQYFDANAKFFSSGDTNGKKAFFCLGQYTRRVSEAQEKAIAESGEENKFQAKLAKQISYNMSYRNYNLLMKLLDNEAMKCDMKLYTQCSGLCKQYIINSDVVGDKNALSVDDANLAFSLGMYQQFK
jgi:hypothetical protein